MKNKEKNKFIKLTRKGISLIVLIITIIVIIILSAVVVMTLNRNNPISSAKEAVFKEDISNFKAELEIYKSNMKYKEENPEKLNANRETTPHIQKVITSMTDKYAKVLEIQNGKLVYVGKDKTEYLLAYQIGMLPEDELLDDEILEELQPFITEWTVSDNDSITLPLGGGSYNFTVDYGDGTGEYKVTSQTDEDRIHTYEKSGTYTVTIKGKLNNFSIYNVGESKDKITKLVQWGSVGITTINFKNCTNLAGEIPEPSKNSFKNVYNFSYLFDNCKNLTGSISENLFKKCTKVKIFDGAFRNCIGLTGEIPKNLFSDCIGATNFYGTFSGCENLTGEIPENLFVTCTGVTNFYGTFSGCKNLTGKIPENLFVNCTKATSFEGIFSGCENLTGEIPETLFDTCTSATNFYSTFYGCTGLTGKAPALWERENVTRYSHCFRNCTNLLNYNEIPSSWGGGGN